MKSFNIILLFLVACFSGIKPGNADDNSAQETSVYQEVTTSGSTYEVSKKNYKNLTDAVVIVRTSYGYGSGTLFKVKDKVIVITAAHVVDDSDYVTVDFSGTQHLSSVVYTNRESDVAILLSPEIEGSKPLPLKIRSDVVVGDRLSYCGYPNRQDLGCFSGEASQISKDYINVHTYAWMGASGSAMVDRRGRLAGVLSGVEVGTVWGRRQIIEDVVWIRPVTEEMIQEAIKKIEDL